MGSGGQFILYFFLHRLKPKFVDNLNSLYPDKRMLFDYVPEMEQPIISHCPIERLWVDNRKGRAQKARLETPFGKITVFNIHAYSFGWRRRHRQMTTLMQEDIVATQDPIVLGGDFNTSGQTRLTIGSVGT